VTIDVALASCTRLPEDDPDEAPLVAALRSRGLRTEVLAWDDASAPFDRARVTVIRSTWNYHRAPEPFAAWLDRVAHSSRLFNAPDVVRWNMHKRYLLELSTRGVAVLPTELVLQGSSRSVAAIRAERGWHDLVIKPAVSAGSRATRRFAASELAAAHAHLRGLLEHEDALVQPYVPEIATRGERSLVWIDGELTHAVRKAARFDGQAEGISIALDVTGEERALAHRAVAAVAKPLFYARVDLVSVSTGPMLMELELIEPSLYFDASRAALERFADGVVRRLTDRLDDH
jgi:glutathione synthase/RimK-type ligase-like ATP-grasp enzyme